MQSYPAGPDGFAWPMDIPMLGLLSKMNHNILWRVKEITMENNLCNQSAKGSRKRRLVLLALALCVAAVTATGTLAYFTAEETAYNVITTGVLAVIPLCLLAKLFGRKLIYIESFAKVTSPTETGKLMYKFADRFYVQ